MNMALGGMASGGGGTGSGGGLYITTGGVVTLKKSTLALNFASSGDNDIDGIVIYL